MTGNMPFRKLRFFWSFILLFITCNSIADSGKPAAFTETFNGTKTSYQPASVALESGPWELDHALNGKSAQDQKVGESSIRLKAGGSASMLFDLSGLYSELQFSYARYGTDKSSKISLWISKDQGKSWQELGTGWRSAAGLKDAKVPLNQSGPFRIRLLNDGPERVNVDELKLWGQQDNKQVLSDAPTYATGRDNPLALGNPSKASKASPDNYLLIRPQYSLSYNAAKGRTNWVAWHLSLDWEGVAPRCNCFFQDTALPPDFYRAMSSDYVASGFDRGHLCPSDDRSGNGEDNAATFLMSNIAPQAPDMNQKNWQELEKYSRELSAKGFEVYSFAGVYGRGGQGKKPGSTETLAFGRLEVPSNFWKILLILPKGENDLSRIRKETRVIAVNIPNQQQVGLTPWREFRCSVASIEKATDYRFFDAVPETIAGALRDKVDVD